MARLSTGVHAPSALRLLVRRPTRTERERRRNLILTSREDRILTALAVHRFLTVAHLERAFFPPAGDSRSAHCVHAYKRVRLLWLWGYLQRSELPRLPDHAGRPPTLWSLAPTGSRYVATLRLAELPRVPRRHPERTSPLFLAHELQAAWCWASLQALLRSGRITHLHWLPEPVLRARHTRVEHPVTGRRLAVLPDAYVELTYPDGRVQCVMLEIDMDTVSDGDIQDKLLALELYQASGQFARDHGHERCETLVLVPCEERRQELLALGREVVPPASWRWYSIATFAVLAPGRLDAALWRNLAGEHTGLLYD